MKTKLFLVLFLVLAGSLLAESKGWQLVQSLAVPGLSQVRSGRNYGYAMLASEAGIIYSMFYLSSEKDLKTRESYDYALKFAHLQPGDYPDDFYRNLGKYSSSGYEQGGYNSMVRQVAQGLYPGNLEAQQNYIDANAYSDQFYWAWDSTSNLSEYAGIRSKIQDLKDFGMMATGVLIVNHLVSGVDVLRYFAQAKHSQVYLDIKDRKPMLILNLEW